MLLLLLMSSSLFWDNDPCVWNGSDGPGTTVMVVLLQLRLSVQPHSIVVVVVVVVVVWWME